MNAYEPIRPSASLAAWCRERGIGAGKLVQVRWQSALLHSPVFRITALGEEKILVRRVWPPLDPAVARPEVAVERADYPRELMAREVDNLPPIEAAQPEGGR